MATYNSLEKACEVLEAAMAKQCRNCRNAICREEEASQEYPEAFSLCYCKGWKDMPFHQVAADGHCGHFRCKALN